jgi:SAM-dependent methyltransferase
MSDQMLGGFSPLDGTIEFYGRINAFLEPGFVVVDLGAGRGGWFSDPAVSPYQRSLRLLKGRVAKVIGLDVDDAVLSNRSTDENIVVTGGTWPLADGSVDVIIADFVLEHLTRPEAVEAEAHRVLRPGGLFCARTPHALNYVCIGSRMAKRTGWDSLLEAAQPAREAADVFETVYQCNTLRRLKRIWAPARWASRTYLYTAEPSYDFGSPAIYAILRVCHRILPLPLVGDLFVFEIRR